MTRLDDVIQKGKELNKAIHRLNDETSVLNAMVQEKRTAKIEEMMQDLNQYYEIMLQLDINQIVFPTHTCMHYYGLPRRMGIKLRMWVYKDKPVCQIDLGVYSDVQAGFYANHSMGTVVSGYNKPEILEGFLEQWNDIKGRIDETFAIEVEKILQERKNQAIKDRDTAITNLTAILQ